jgi:hypothetical protein
MKIHLLTLIAAVALPIVAKAQNESFTYNIPATSLSTVLNDSFNLNAFDPSLGTLTGVTITLDLQATASPQVINTSGGAGSFTVSSYFPTTLTGPHGSSVSATTASGLLSGTANTGVFSITPVPGSEVDQSVDTVVPTGNLSSYEGTNPLTFTLVAPSGAGFTTSGTETTGTATLAYGGGGSIDGGTATVDYTYTVAAPEPSSWVLGFIAIGTLFFLRRRVTRV